MKIRRDARLVIVTAAVGIVVILIFVLLGGGRFQPAEAADPCQTRAWRSPEGIQGVIEQVALSGLDGAACELRMTREELALAIADDDLDRVAREKNIDDSRLEELLRTGLRRAVLDGQRSGALAPAVAFVLGQAIDQLDINRIIELYRDGDLDWIGSLIP